MNSKLFIFPITLTDDNFLTLSEIRQNLTQEWDDKIDNLSSCKQNIIYYLAKACIDIQEIITNKNSKGYRYNSYLLNISMIKLEYVVQLLAKNDSTYFKHRIQVIHDAIDQIDIILRTGKCLYDSDCF